ncbi:hypothetical protein CGRA01v4_12055 [Colletotrichum graminicola]|nr:hypothetical protein CGRA01v4_12055 [Colletotrichum graminicola]
MPTCLPCRICCRMAPPNFSATPHILHWIVRALVSGQAMYLCPPMPYPVRFFQESVQRGEKIQRPVPLEFAHRAGLWLLGKVEVWERPPARRVTRERLVLSLQVDKQRQTVTSGGSTSTNTSSGNNVGPRFCSE